MVTDATISSAVHQIVDWGQCADIFLVILKAPFLSINIHQIASFLLFLPFIR
jgi:hypothetical protein